MILQSNLSGTAVNSCKMGYSVLAVPSNHHQFKFVAGYGCYVPFDEGRCAVHLFIAWCEDGGESGC